MTTGAADPPRHEGAGLERRGRGAFLVLGFVPVFLSVVLLWATEQYRTEAAWVDHTHDVLAALAAVEQSTIRAESSARAFFATKDKTWIAEFEQLQQQEMAGLQDLRRLVSDNPAQQKEADELRQVAEERLHFLADSIQMVISGTSVESLAAARGTTGRQTIAALNQETQEMRSEEQRLLAERLAARRTTNRVLTGLCLCAMVFSFVIAVRGGIMIRRYRDLRDRAEAQLKSLNQELENRVRERTQDLERSNEDLRQFAFASSHDLREPLRTIHIYTDMLGSRYADRLDGDAQQVLKFILLGVQRMDQLLTGLRTYMQVSTLTGPAAPIDLKTGVDSAMLDLKAAIDASGASIECGELPKVRMHPVQARQIFQNLIGNALKFRSERNPVISITAEQAGNEWVIRVRDNGVGIDPKYQAQIFGLFKRLHPADEIPGSGLGLSICRAIVQRCGGRMWVDSEPNQGSTFSFTVPRAT